MRCCHLFLTSCYKHHSHNNNLTLRWHHCHTISRVTRVELSMRRCHQVRSGSARVHITNVLYVEPFTATLPLLLPACIPSRYTRMTLNLCWAFSVRRCHPVRSRLETTQLKSRGTCSLCGRQGTTWGWVLQLASPLLAAICLAPRRQLIILSH